MVPLAAEIFTAQSSLDGRSAVRRSLRLPVSAHNSDHVAMALVLNISETGVLIETVLDLQVGETLQLEIPQASGATVRVIWREKLLVGCEFFQPLPTSAVSAAQLLSPIDAPEETGQNSASGIEPHQARDGASVEWVEAAVLIVTAIIAMMSALILIAALATLR